MMGAIRRMDRRQALAVLCAAAATAAAPLATSAESGCTGGVAAVHLRMLVAALARVPEFAPIFADYAVRRCVSEDGWHAMRRSDFFQGRVVRLGGWQFAHSEIRYLAAVAEAATADPRL